METIMAEPVQDDEQPRLVNHVVSQVVKSTTFLQVAGIQLNYNNSSKCGTSSKVQVHQVPTMHALKLFSLHICASSRHRSDLCLIKIYTYL